MGSKIFIERGLHIPFMLLDADRFGCDDDYDDNDDDGSRDDNPNDEEENYESISEDDVNIN